MPRHSAGGLGGERVSLDEARVADIRGLSAAGSSAGVRPRGELWAAMLDTKQSWDDLIRRHAPDAKTRDAILANPLYQNLMGRFVQSHDYIAMERLYGSDLHDWLEKAGFKKVEVSLVAREEQPPHFQTLLASGEK